MKSFDYIQCIFFFLMTMSHLEAQTNLRGNVIDDATGESLPGANVVISGTTIGTVTDLDGEFSLRTELTLPMILQISYAGYETKLIEVVSDARFNRIKLTGNNLMDEATIVEWRITDEQKESQSSEESFDIIDIRQTPGIDLPDALKVLKEVDVMLPSFGFKVINMRGFNSTSPVRSLQIIDGVDNQAPGLNFSLGNFLGLSELDVLKVDIIAGASGAYYGPAAFNGVISMETKSPFIHQGFSGLIKVGERNLVEGAIRFADAYQNKSGHDVFGYKLNLFALHADDWKAENYEPITDSEVPADNPGRYDAVNIYGDHYYKRNDFTDPSSPCRALFLYPGAGVFYRKGYKEVDLVDYNTKNYKANLALDLRTKPSQGITSPSILFSSSYGAGTTVYQGDNRFSLRDIHFVQNKIEFRKQDKFFIRAYHTYENAGNSYDPYFTALRLQEMSKSEIAWNNAYTNYWWDVADIPGRMEDLGYQKFECDSAQQWLLIYADSLTQWHAQAADYANTKTSRDPAGSTAFFQPGTARFDSAFQSVTTRLNNEQGGTGFYDKSQLYHVGGEYIFTPAFLSELRVGGSYRLYMPSSKGTIFSDTAGTTIRNSEFGLYAGVKKKFFNQKLIGSATVRADKNENLNWVYTPAASLIYNPWPETYLRFSFSSAVRNPTLSDQYLYLNVGPAILAGHIGRVDSLITSGSFQEYLNTGDYSRLEFFNIDPIRPERVKTLEVGLRTTLFKSIYTDLSYYRNTYRDFLGYLIGLTAIIDMDAPIANFKDLQVFRYSANTKNKVTTHGFSIGIQYYLSQTISIRGNYGFNALRKTIESDPIIPAYNTPEHKFNIGFSGRDLKLSNNPFLNSVGFNVNYKWVEGFRFEGSPQFTGHVPSYGVVDAQVNTTIIKHSTTIKAGVSNLLGNNHIETYGGPRVGRMAYVSIAYRF